MRVSLPVLSDDEVAAQVAQQKQGLAASTVKRAVNKALADRRANAASVQAEYDGKAHGRFTTHTVAVKDAKGNPASIMTTLTVPKD
jgi:hypothetical protein